MEGQKGDTVFNRNSEDLEEVSVNCFDGKSFCGKCCYQTEMPLTKSDIARIEALGYKKSDFVVKDGTVFRLRNVEGKCFFLDSKNRCIIYEYRPEGCRLYPAVFDGKDVVADSLCPKWTEVKITVHSKQKLLTLIKSIYGEKVFNE